jgi:hypothetical protein
MDGTMTPRDIQLRIRSGDSLDEVIAASGLPADRVEAFAAPILAEREHTTSTALSAPVRRRGETASARRLQPTVAESLLDHGQDIDFVTWDSWRRSDGRWILQGTWQFDGQDKSARFVYDPKGRFSMADNDQARLLVGDLPLVSTPNPATEPTVEVTPVPAQAQSNLADEITVSVAYEREPEEADVLDGVEDVEDGIHEDEDGDEDSLRSDIDLLYDMISTIDEDSVRIFRGLRDPLVTQKHHEIADPDQPSLIDEPGTSTPPDHPQSSGKRKSRKRASVPSWDDIIFGGQS